MRVTDLEPRWFAPAGRSRTGLTFQCPHCKAAGLERPVRLAVPFATPLDGGAPVPMGWKLVRDLGGVDFDVPADFLWGHTGDSFENLTLSPSVDASASGHWHGFVQNGEIR